MKATEKGTVATKAANEALVASSHIFGGYSPRISTEELLDDIDKTGRNFAALVAGFPGDIADIFPAADYGALKNFPTSEEMAEKLGGDPEHWSWLPAALVAPGPGEAKGLLASGKALLNGIDPSWAMTLFHGTPHKFSKFELEKIGTGEGAQAYGHGLYFAESPGVAGGYRDTLSAGNKVTYTGFDEVPINVQKILDEPLPETWGENELINTLMQDGKKAEADWLFERMYELDTKPIKGHLYEVDIPDETISAMLDWDAPLSEQPESVKKALRQIGIEPSPSVPARTGGDIIHEMGSSSFYDTPERMAKYDALSGKIGGSATPRQIASEILNEAGIPGIRFLDGSSRKYAGGKLNQIEKTPQGWRAQITHKDGRFRWSDAFNTKAEAKQWAEEVTSKGTRNIVLFNPDDIKSVKRDGELVYKK